MAGSAPGHTTGMNAAVAVAVALVGFSSGVLSGMFGVGGAVLTTPGVRVLGATPIESVGSTIPAILPGALSGAWRYRKERLIDVRVALTCGALGSTFAVIGANVADIVNARYLMLATAGLLLWNGLQNFLVAISRQKQRAFATKTGGTGYLRNLLVVLSARILPSVWQVGQ